MYRNDSHTSTNPNDFVVVCGCAINVVLCYECILRPTERNTKLVFYKYSRRCLYAELILLISSTDHCSEPGKCTTHLRYLHLYFIIIRRSWNIHEVYFCSNSKREKKTAIWVKGFFLPQSNSSIFGNFSFFLDYQVLIHRLHYLINIKFTR